MKKVNQKTMTIVRVDSYMINLIVMIIRKHQKMRQVNEKKMTNRSVIIVRIVINEKYCSNSSEIVDSEDNDESNRSERMLRIVIHKFSTNED